jgi:muconolactone delta-isomerase
MGAGDAGLITRAAVRNYGRYRPIHPEGFGYFAVSVFAVTGTVTTDAILAAMPHGQYSTCRAEHLLEHASRMQLLSCSQLFNEIPNCSDNR